MPHQSSRPAVFLDRDGTLIEDIPYLHEPQGVRLLPGVADGLKRLRAAGFTLAVATNQSGIARGYYAEADMHRVNMEMLRQLHREGVDLDGVYFAPHLPDADHPDRKPSPGMLLRAADELRLDLARSWMVGDQVTDLEAGRRAGCRAILVSTGRKKLDDPAAAALWGTVCADFAAAARRILESPGMAIPGDSNSQR